MKKDNFLNKLDFFGVNFEFRMENYEKFRTKTGGTAFIIYLSLSSFCFLMILYYFIFHPKYLFNDVEIPTHSQKIKLIEDKFNLAIKLPEFKYRNISREEYAKMFIIRATHKVRNISRLININIPPENKTNIPTKPCNYTNLFNYENKDFKEYEGTDLICFDFSKNHSIVNTQFKDHTYIRIDIWVHRDYYLKYQEFVKEHMRSDPFFLNLMFPQNLISDDYTKSKQFLNGIFLYLNEKEKIVTDLYMKKSIYSLDDSIYYNSPKNYTYSDYFSHESYYIADDYSYQPGKNEHPKILKLYLRNDVMLPIYYKSREKIWSFLQKINSLYVNIFLSFKVFVLIINMYKAKMHVLSNLFEVNFKNFDNSESLNENEAYVRLKKDLYEHVSFLKNDKMKKKRNEENVNPKQNNKLNGLSENAIKNFPCPIESIGVTDSNNNKAKNDFAAKVNEIQVRNQSLINNNFNSNTNKSESADPGSCGGKRLGSFKKTNNLKDFELMDIPENNSSGDAQINNFGINIAKEKETKRNKSAFVEINLNTTNSLNNSLSNKLVSKLPMENVISMTQNNGLFKTETDLEAEEKHTNKNKISLRSLIQIAFSCNCLRLKKQISYFEKAEKLFDEFFDIQQYIMKMNEVEILKNMILDHNQKVIFEFLSFPAFSYSLKRDLSINPDSDAIKDSNEKTGIDYQKDKLIANFEKLFIDQDNNNKSKRLQMMYENKIK